MMISSAMGLEGLAVKAMPETSELNIDCTVTAVPCRFMSPCDLR